ncbi:MAG: class II aldolase/adducin family protein [Thermodesulfovibrio sp.]|nr:class II aldolase/adducin family protein [Thermodesulfovibrio sp.]
MQYKKERKEVVKISKKLYKLGLVSLKGGNVSQKVKSHVLITPKGKSYITLKPKDIVLIDLDGRVLEENKQPSTDYRVHLEIYKAKDDTEAVVHTHSIFASVVACLNIEIPVIFEEQKLLLERLPVVGYAPSGSLELAKNVAEALKDSKAVLIEKHGVVATGKTLIEAFYISELVERLCKIFYFLFLFKNSAQDSLKHSL